MMINVRAKIIVTNFLGRIFFGCGVILFGFFFPSFTFAGSKTGADFLKIPIGARAVGLGQAYTALAQDVDSLTWNPAGLAKPYENIQQPLPALMLSHQQMFFDTNLDFVGFSL